MTSEILLQLHGSPTSAHFPHLGEWARQFCYWPSMYKDIKTWFEQCKICQTRRGPVPSAQPFERVAMDILELPVTTKETGMC